MINQQVNMMQFKKNRGDSMLPFNLNNQLFKHDNKNKLVQYL